MFVCCVFFDEMPRKIMKTPLNTAKKRASIFKHIQQDLGEESATDESDFHSVSTDNGVTNYDLEYTSRTLRSAEKSKSTSPAKKSNKQTPQPARRGETSRSSGARDKTQPSTSGIRTPRKAPATSAAANQSQKSPSWEQSQQRRTPRVKETGKSTAPSRPGPSREAATGSKKRKGKSPRRKNHILKEIRQLQTRCGKHNLLLSVQGSVEPSRFFSLANLALVTDKPLS